MAFRASTDAVLIARVRAGNTASYDELYRRHFDDTRRLARLVTWTDEEAEEITAEAFTRVLARLRAGGGPADDFVPYLRTIVRRLAVDHRRSARHEVSVPGPGVMEAIPEPDDEIDIVTTRTMVRQAYETLPPRWQQVLWHTRGCGDPEAAAGIVLSGVAAGAA